MKQEWKEIIDKLLLPFFPRRCALCGRLVALDEELCEVCQKREQIPLPKCTACGLAKADCRCKGKHHEYNGITAPFYYKDSVVAGIHNLKFNEQPLLAEKMGACMAACAEESFPSAAFDCVASVPLTRRRQNARGYNQAELLAKSVAAQLSVPYKNLLVKRFNNQVQRKENARQRRINVYGAYDVADGVDVLNKTVLLVDDVKTTGSTLNECAKMLKMHGASAVYVVTYAVVCNTEKA